MTEIKRINDQTLLTECKSAVTREKKAISEVLEYLAEIDRRQLYLKEGYSSLFDFSIRFLNYSEGEAYRRIQACRLVCKVAELKPLLEEGNLSLTAMCLLSPHLTKENAQEILPKVINQPSREVEKVLAQTFPDSAKRPEIFTAELDTELISLIEKAKELASEKEPARFLKKILTHYIREKQPRSSVRTRHTRYVAAPIAREVKKLANYQCEFRGANGIRCNQKAHLQIDHIRPYAKGGSSIDIDNLRCLCKAHNLYQAKLDFPGMLSLRKRIQFAPGP